MSLLSILKGWFGEKATQFGMWAKLDEETYMRFHNLIIQTENGTTQIDHILLSRYGIFVIETKNYNGWIYGGEKQKSWTQNLFGKKSHFQNPLHQNYKHTKALSECLQVEHSKIHSIVFFIGDAELKSDFPPNVMSRGLSSYIESFTKVIFSESEVEMLRRNLEKLRNGQGSSRQHAQSLRDRYSDTAKCPKCGGRLVERTARNGPRAGEKFIGCSSYPKCRHIKT
ncbi:MAG: NERD domain-containing protein [Nitrospirae bacterium]|nr:MAG: NERD domain-containing protein [Nitrospirota bacterium]